MRGDFVPRGISPTSTKGKVRFHINTVGVEKKRRNLGQVETGTFATGRVSMWYYRRGGMVPAIVLVAVEVKDFLSFNTEESREETFRQSSACVHVSQSISCQSDTKNDDIVFFIHCEGVLFCPVKVS